MSPLDFWHACIGRHLAATAEESYSAVVPTRTNSGIKPLRIGAIDVYYIAAEEHSELIGRLSGVSSNALSYVRTEEVSASKRVATWLIESGTTPFMVGVIAKASPLGSFDISAVPQLATFCQSSGNMNFDLVRVREAASLLRDSGLPWKTTVAPGIYAYEAFAQADDSQRHQESLRLKKQLARAEGLRSLLPELRRVGIKPGSGEYRLLSWYNIER